MPVQVLPAAACGCTSGKSCCEPDEQSKDCQCAASREGSAEARHSCCQQRAPGPCRCTGEKVGRCGESSRCRKQPKSCCAGRVAKGTCCAANDSVTFGASACKCGVNCQCNTSKEPKPDTPPVENNSSRKVAGESNSTVSVGTVYQPQTTWRHNVAFVEADALAALDRCVSLCRFTL